MTPSPTLATWKTRNLSPIMTPRAGRGEIERGLVCLLCQEQAHHTDLTRMKGTTITLVWLDVIPMPRRINETAPHNGGNGYETHHSNTDR